MIFDDFEVPDHQIGGSESRSEPGFQDFKISRSEPESKDQTSKERLFTENGHPSEQKNTQKREKDKETPIRINTIKYRNK